MGKIIERLEKENERDEGNSLRLVHMYKDGTFFHSYNWSAWLFSQHLKPGIKVIRARKKSNNPEHVFVGVPVSTTDQYVKSEHVSVHHEGEDFITLELDNSLISDEVSYNTLFDAYTKWYEALPLPKEKEQMNERDLPFYSDAPATSASRPSSFGILDVMKEIMVYPIEQHSPNETQAFLAEIKQKLTRLL